MADVVTFGLAFVAYALLGVQVVLHMRRQGRRAVAVAVAAIALAHVALVWGGRFDWSLDAAVAKGWSGFTIFHVALAIIVVAAVASPAWSRRCTLMVFPIVTAGALGAAFRYDFVSGYRWPLITVLATVVALGFHAWRATDRR